MKYSPKSKAEIRPSYSPMCGPNAQKDMLPKVILTPPLCSKLAEAPYLRHAWPAGKGLSEVLEVQEIMNTRVARCRRYQRTLEAWSFGM